MRRSKWLAIGMLILGGVLVAGTDALAAPQGATQGSGGTSAGQKPYDETTDPDLKLTDDQKSQIKQINQSRRDQIKAVAQDSSLTGEQKSAKIREINKGSNEQVRGLLTAEQRERWERRRRDRREDVRDRREDKRDRKEDKRDRREDRRDRKRRP